MSRFYYKLSQRFCIILVTGCKIRQLRMLRSWRWPITLDWDAELTWYSPITTRRISLHAFELDLGNYGFRPNIHCLTVEILAIWAKFLETSGYSSAMNCTFIFPLSHNKYFLVVLAVFMVQFELIKYKFPN